MITLDDFAKVEIKVGTILEATTVEGADKLLKLIFDFGLAEQNAEEEESKFDPEIMAELHATYPGRNVRQVMSAIRPFFEDPHVLVGKQICVVTNLEPRKFRGYESQGMIVAVGDKSTGVTFIGPESPVAPGTKLF